MIDLDKYEEAIVFKQELECGGVIAVGRDDLLHVIDRLRQAEKDAARYRWLRDNSVDLDWVVYGEEKTHVDITVWHNDGFDSANSGVDATPKEIDALIDEAMQCNK